MTTTKANHPKEWSFSSNVRKKDTNYLVNGISTSEKNNPNGISDRSSRPARRSILQRFTGIGTKSAGVSEVGSRLCGSIIKFKLNTNPHDNAGYTENCKLNNGMGGNQIVTIKNGDDNSSSIKTVEPQKELTIEDSNENSQPELNSVVTVFHHKNASCYEVCTYDIATKKELNRLYVPAEEVTHITERKKGRMSFISGGRSSFIGGNRAVEKKLSMKFGDLMSFTLDDNKKECVDILLPDPKNPRRKVSIAFPKPDNITPATMHPPNFKKDGSLAPFGKRVSILQKIGRLSLFGGTKSTSIIPIQPTPAPSIDSVAENTEDQDIRPKWKAPMLSDVPKQLSSTHLTHNLKYEKSVDEMLDEASQMRADLAARRAAEGNTGANRFGKKKKKR